MISDVRAIWSWKNHFLMLYSFKLCPLVGEKLLFESKLVTAVIDLVKSLESFDHIPSHAMVY